MSTTEERLRLQHAQHEADRARFIVERGDKARCPNCREQVVTHAENGCALALLIQLVRERGDHSEHTLLNLHYMCDTDKMWDDLGPVVDQMERGDYNK